MDKEKDSYTYNKDGDEICTSHDELGRTTISNLDAMRRLIDSKLKNRTKLDKIFFEGCEEQTG